MTIDSTPLAGKTAIVTGGSRGIGNAICRALSARGANVVIVYASQSSDKISAELAMELTNVNEGKKAIALRADLSGPAGDPEALIIFETLNAFPAGIDILVNNAGQAWAPVLGDIKPSDFEALFRVNTLAPLLLLQAALPHLNRPGRVINIGSVASRTALPGTSPLYSGSKAALDAFTRTAAVELGADGTIVNMVLPGGVDTDMAKGASTEMLAMIKQKTPVEHRLGRVEDIADVVAWLAEEGARWVSGQSISVSGGSVLL